MLGTVKRAENKAVKSMPFWNVYASRARESPAQFTHLGSAGMWDQLILCGRPCWILQDAQQDPWSQPARGQQDP